MTSKTLEFDIHRNLLASVIEAQAGSLSKALLEGVMNSIDAGATRVRVTLDCEQFQIRDDGKGIQTLEHIQQWFATFGTPHEAGDARHGRFRAGRGQLFSFAKTSWRTGTFAMAVDIRGKQNLTYDLNEGLRRVKGCTVDGHLYDPLDAATLDQNIRDLSALVRYAEIPVVLNGKLISQNPADAKWDDETPEAYLRLSRTGDLMVYNMGMLVRSFPNYEYGCGGAVVSKVPLEVNLARNDILTQKCKVWGGLTKELRRVNLEKLATKSSLTLEERNFAARQWAYYTLPEATYSALRKMKLFTDATGRHHTIDALLKAAEFTVAKSEQRNAGTRLHRAGKVFVLAEETLSRFGCGSSAQDLLSTLGRGGDQGTYLRETLQSKFVEFNRQALADKDLYRSLEDHEVHASALTVLEALREIYPDFMVWFTSSEMSSGPRQLRAGKSSVAIAWTDGSSYIAFHEKELLKASRSLEGCFELLLTTVHEQVHDSADAESHEHDVCFHAKHHDLVQYHGAGLLVLCQKLWSRVESNLRHAKPTTRVKPRRKPGQREEIQLSLLA